MVWPSAAAQTCKKHLREWAPSSRNTHCPNGQHGNPSSAVQTALVTTQGLPGERQSPWLGLEEWSAVKPERFQDTNQPAQKCNPKMSWEPPKHNPTCQTSMISTAQANRDLRTTQKGSKGSICCLLGAALSHSFFYSFLEDVSACKYLEEEEDNFPFGVFTFSLATKQNKKLSQCRWAALDSLLWSAVGRNACVNSPPPGNEPGPGTG